MICPVCGHQNREDHLFCTQCGVKLADTQRRIGRLIMISESPLTPQQRRRGGGETRTEPERRKGAEIIGTTFTLGRRPDNDLILNDGQASAHHARITSDGRVFWMEDLGSTNGTYVDGERIESRIRLTSESLIRIGSTIVKFAVQPIEPPNPQPPPPPS